MNRPKQKGTAAETGVIRALHQMGWPGAERRTLSGSNDRGDVNAHSGFVMECKDTKKWSVPKWMRETEAERINASAAYGILVIKAPGIGAPNARRWITVMDQQAFYNLRLLAYGRSGSWRRFRTVDIDKAVGAEKAYAELAYREKQGGDTPVSVNFIKKRTGLELETGNLEPVLYSMMRLEDRCKLLVDAGYGGHAIMGATTSDIVREDDDDGR